MTRLKKTFLFFFCAFLLFVSGAQAQDIDGYTKPSMSNLFKTLIRFGAVSIKNSEIVDAYGRVTECEIYLKYHSQDFEWHRVRKALRESIKMNAKTFPTAYYFDTNLQLGKYDFKDNIYRFTDKTAQSRTNVFTIQAHDEERCVKGDYKFPPLEYRFILSKPILVQGIPLSPEDGDILLKRMEKEGNEDRLVYTRFKFRVTYIGSLSKEAMGGKDHIKNEEFVVRQKSGLNSEAVDIDAQLDSIEYFEDPARTRLIYSVQY